MRHSLWTILLILMLPFVVYGNNDLLMLQQDDGQWVTQGKNYALTRYSPLKQITAQNVHRLNAAWTFSLGVLRGQEGSPLVIGTTMYVHTGFPNLVYALDLTREGAPITWSYTPEQSPDVPAVACCDTVYRGLAYAEGKIFMAQLDTHVVALDARTGKELWKVKQGDHKTGQTITAAPIVIKDKVITGISGGEFGVRGFVTANNINTGEQVWRAFSTGPDADVLIGEGFQAPYPSHEGKDLGVSTWKGDEWQRGGGTTWGWYSYDPELNLFYYSTGNPGSWNPTQRPGDNKWSMTIFARDADTGMAKWAYQMTPHDEWDYDGVNENILVDLTIRGKAHKALVHFDRNGFAYTIDRTNGKLLVAEKFGPVNWATKVDLQTGVPVRVEEKGTQAGKNTKDICPAAIGAKDQQPAAYSPRTGLFYVPTNNICMDYEGVPVRYQAGQWYVGAIVRMFAGPGGNRGEFMAWDATTGEKVWGLKENLAAYGGALATAGDVVFYGTMEGWLKAINARTGEVLWKFKTGSGIIANPMTYLGPDGKQYIAVISGVGGWAGVAVALDIGPEDPTAGLGALGAFGDATRYSTKGAMLYVFGL
jgi:PQQ-dependent dehydrogenase (methanol/ethanol family)